VKTADAPLGRRGRILIEKGSERADKMENGGKRRNKGEKGVKGVNNIKH
jgi:hypothetical protein